MCTGDLKIVYGKYVLWKNWISNFLHQKYLLIILSMAFFGEKKDIYLFERCSCRKRWREREISHPLGDSADGSHGQRWARRLIWAFTWVQGPKYLGYLLLLIQPIIREQDKKWSNQVSKQHCHGVLLLQVLCMMLSLPPVTNIEVWV